MQVNEIMTMEPACCMPEQSIQEAAKLMLTQDCGCIPVVDGSSHRIVGLITDRDIAVRAVAAGKDPSKTCVAETMSHPVVSIQSESAVESCVKMMEENQVRRAPVVDSSGRLIGMIAQADIARTGSPDQVAELVSEVSKGADIGHS
jgi:CBS domain-containing protein